MRRIGDAHTWLYDLSISWTGRGQRGFCASKKLVRSDGDEWNATAVPEALNVLLGAFHVHKDDPHVPSFGMKVDNSPKEGLAAFGISVFIFKLGETRDGLKVYRGVRREVSWKDEWPDIRFRFSRL